jgi:hypothetical protein
LTTPGQHSAPNLVNIARRFATNKVHANFSRATKRDFGRGVRETARDLRKAGGRKGFEPATEGVIAGQYQGGAAANHACELAPTPCMIPGVGLAWLAVR